MKTAIVTGAARGIGLATAKLLQDEGWQSVLVDRDAPELAKAAAALPEAIAIEADVSQPDQVARMVEETLGATGRIDGLVNNAGVGIFARIEETDFTTWREVMATNLDGVFLCAQAAHAALCASRGAIVNIASISGLRASTLRTAYGTSKAAVIQLTRQQAAELGEYWVRVNCVCPGPVDTKLSRGVHTPEIRAAYHEAIPLNRYGTETEIAQTIAFLLSDKASYVTGQIIAADGGFESTGIGLPALRN